MKVDLTKDLCPKHDLCHRALVKRTKEGWQVNCPFTLQNLWEYLWIGVLGRKHPLGNKTTVTREELDKARAAMVASIREMTEAEAEYLDSCCTRYGLQAVLFAADIYCMDDDIDEFYPDDFGHCLRQGQVEVSTALFKYNHPEVGP